MIIFGKEQSQSNRSVRTEKGLFMKNILAKNICYYLFLKSIILLNSNHKLKNYKFAFAECFHKIKSKRIFSDVFLGLNIVSIYLGSFPNYELLRKKKKKVSVDSNFSLSVNSTFICESPNLSKKIVHEPKKKYQKGKRKN